MCILFCCERALALRKQSPGSDDQRAVRTHECAAESLDGPPIRLGPALPVAKLRSYYAEGERRSGVAWQVLAAVNFVESDFGRLRESSVDGAQGPMQFMPATWASYGRGDVHDPQAAILAAARFLRAAGAPAAERAALLRYNPSSLYVDAVERYAGRIRRDPAALLVFYARAPLVR